MVRLEHRQGRTTFQLADIVREVLAHCDTHPETTIRTMVTSVMCANAPVHHVNRTPDLERMSHGQYRRIVDWDAAEASPRSPDADVAPTAIDPAAVAAQPDRHLHWAWEGNVQSAVATALAAAGWQLRSLANTATREHGVDVIAERSGRRLLVEVKGYPDGSTSANTQARHLYAGALLAGLLMPEDDPEAGIVLAFPEYKTYENLVRRTTRALRTLGIGVLSVSETGIVTEQLAPAGGAVLEVDG